MTYLIIALPTGELKYLLVSSIYFNYRGLTDPLQSNHAKQTLPFL